MIVHSGVAVHNGDATVEKVKERLNTTITSCVRLLLPLALRQKEKV